MSERQTPVVARWLILATGLAAAVPVISSIVRSLSGGWVPVADEAIIATRAYDVFTSQTPLVGPWSTSSNILGKPTFHPGPLLNWLLAVPTRLPYPPPFPLIMGGLNVAAIVGAVALARRRGGLPLMFATAAALAAMCGSLQTEVLNEVFGPSAPLLPFTLLIFVCWSVACGDHRLLPLAVLIASFAMQCHLVFVLPSLALVGTGLIGLIVTRGRNRDSRSVRRWSLAALVVAALCWSAPLVDQALSWSGSHRGYGNFATLVDVATSRQAPVGLKGGAYSVVRSVGVPPGWLRAPQEPIVRVFELFRRPGPLALISAAVVLVGLVVCLGVAYRRRRADVVAACALALVLCAALGAVTASFPNVPSNIFAYGYAGRWAAPVGMWAWLALGWSVATLWAPRGALRGTPASGVAQLAAVGAVLVVGLVVAAGQGRDSDQQLFDPARTVVEALDARLPQPGSVRVDGTNLELESAVVYALRRHGAAVGTGLGIQFGSAYAVEGRRFHDIVDIGEGDRLPRGARLVARVEVGPPTRRTFTISLRPG